jgi:hypothetical protein
LVEKGTETTRIFLYGDFGYFDFGESLAMPIVSQFALLGLELDTGHLVGPILPENRPGYLRLLRAPGTPTTTDFSSPGKEHFKINNGANLCLKLLDFHFASLGNEVLLPPCTNHSQHIRGITRKLIPAYSSAFLVFCQTLTPTPAQTLLSKLI